MNVVAGTPALLTDGRVVLVRTLGEPDSAEVLGLHERLDERDGYLRFFSPVRTGLDTLARHLAAPPDAAHAALGVFLGGRLVGVADYEVLADPTVAEVAFVVDAAAQTHGVGTLLLEHLGSLARRRGVRRFVAEVLAENTRMMRVFTDSGLPYRVSRDGSVLHVELALEQSEAYLAALGERERVADTASLRPLLRPRSVVVVGAGRRTSSLGRAVLRNLRHGSYTGVLYAVNPHATEVLGVSCVPSVLDLPDAPELAIVCVPAAAVPEVVEDCGRRGVRAVVVISAGLTGTPLGEQLLAAARRHGVRLVGPNCLGIANAESDVRLDATFARGLVPPGSVGVVTQSGGVGIALLEELRQLGLGVSTLVSTGEKYDVSGNDMLLWWQRDQRTDLAVLHLESFGNPRKFSRLARALARIKPVLAVRTGSTEVARRAAASHTASAATTAVTRDALFEQAGVIAVDTIAELVDVVAVLSWQPLPGGGRVAVVSNAGGAGVLAADACAQHGLVLPDLADVTTARLRALLPPHASPRNPVDTTAALSPEVFGQCLDAVLADDGVDAVIAATVPTALGDPITAVPPRAACGGKPVVAVRLGQLAAVAPLTAGTGPPASASFADPAAASATLGRLARYATWLREPTGQVPDVPGVDVSAALALVRQRFAADPAGGWLSPTEATTLLRCFGIPAVDNKTAEDEDAAVAAYHELGGPVVVKALAEGVVHKSTRGGVLLDRHGEREVRGAVRELRRRFGPALRGVLLQPMVERGRELLVGVSGDAVFGPLVVFGLGGVDTDLVADRAARLTPLTDRDADRLLHGLRSSPALFGPDSELDVAAIRDVLLRVGRLAELVPEIAELDLNPLVARTNGCLVLDARVRIQPREPADPFLRRLR